MEESVPSPVSVGRYLFAALVGTAALVGLLLVARPLLFTMARPLDDTNYTVVAVSQVTDGPIARQLLLNESHGWAGELVQDDRTQISVIVAPLTIGGFSVVNAWSRPMTARWRSVPIGCATAPAMRGRSMASRWMRPIRRFRPFQRP